MHITEPDHIDHTPDISTCPKCGFERREMIECGKCGIVFEKYHTGPSRVKNKRRSESAELPNTADLWMSRAKKLSVAGLMSFFFFYMVIRRSSWCFLDFVNLPFHEFGHILFRPFGETIQFLGGTIGQLMWPCILIVYFMNKKEGLSASFCLFWFGENFLNISKYVADSRSLSLPLVGGGVHDWNFLLSKWGALQNDHRIAHIIFIVGVIVMTVSIGWALFTSPVRSNSLSR